MSQYVFIESRDPFTSGEAGFVAEVATALRRRGNEVTVFLVQNGVLAARKTARNTRLGGLAEAGVRLLADDFSLCERGIQADEIGAGIEPSTIDLLVELLARHDTKAIWH
jgi:sulfur relay (sulfurtransferase) complex TusBCD TusD component (DsrE family)